MQRRDITTEAVTRQVEAMGCDVFEVGVFDAEAERMLIKTWDKETVLRSVPYLKHQNMQGNHIYIRPHGEHGLTLVDDYKITIGKSVLIGPNVTISTTNHPLHYKMRLQGQMYCRAVVIEDHVWIGSNVVICAGVTIGKGAVIGAGSVVTRDIPPMTLAFGVPCRAVREITDADLDAFEPIPGIE